MTEKILQFGTGNFLRAFIEPFIQALHDKHLYDGGIVVVQPTPGGKTALLNAQNGQYNVILRGIENGSPVCRFLPIKCVTRGVDPYTDFDEYIALAQNPSLRFVISNTTEAGIVFHEGESIEDRPAASFPGKLTQLLYRRFRTGLPGFVFLPCELIDRNGDALRKAVLQNADAWGLGSAFCHWIEKENRFCNTLVDRIVTGYPKDAGNICDALGICDRLLDAAEPYHLWAIEADFEHELPLQRAGLNVIWTTDISPHKKMKVRILNGAHTALVFPSLLCGVQTVKDSMEDPLLLSFLNYCIDNCILPAIGNSEENTSFAASTLDRFKNPYLEHLWRSIALNSVSKFAVRLLPTVSEYTEKTGKEAKPLFFSLGCLIHWYRTGDPSDSVEMVEKIRAANLKDILSDVSLWGISLDYAFPIVLESMERIEKDGIREALRWAIT